MLILRENISTYFNYVFPFKDWGAGHNKCKSHEWGVSNNKSENSCLFQFHLCKAKMCMRYTEQRKGIIMTMRGNDGE